MAITKNDVCLTCLIAADEMEFVCDPREISDEMKLATLLGFMSDVALLLGKTIHLGYENERWEMGIRFDPSRGEWNRPER